jgi:hypothetical protein
MTRTLRCSYAVKRCSAPASTKTAVPSHGNFLALDLEYACPLEDNVELVITVGLLSVGLWGYEAIDSDFEAGGLVNDLVANADPSQSLLDGCDFE